ncbi:MAG: hypothetical protein IPG06_24485 [Haliea sp.]|nr:hypothetical protein [Haliea sp.]
MTNRLHFLIIALLLHPAVRLSDPAPVRLAGAGWLDHRVDLYSAVLQRLVVRVYLRHANFGLVFWLRRGRTCRLGVPRCCSACCW